MTKKNRIAIIGGTIFTAVVIAAIVSVKKVLDIVSEELGEPGEVYFCEEE